MKLLRKSDNPSYKYTIAMMGYANEEETTILELAYNYGVTEYTRGNAYAKVVISTDDVYKNAEYKQCLNDKPKKRLRKLRDNRVDASDDEDFLTFHLQRDQEQQCQVDRQYKDCVNYMQI